MSSATLRSFSARSLPDIFGHGPSSNAFARGLRWRAAASSRPALATSAIFSPVDGAKVGNVSPDCGVDPLTVDEELGVGHGESPSSMC